MANTRFYLFISIVCMLAGIIFSAFYTEHLIVRSPIDTIDKQFFKSNAIKKKVTLTFWHHNQWHTETQEIMWSESKTENLTFLITNWLNVLDEEHKKGILQSALLSASEYDAYLSFDDNPLPQKDATIEKLRWIDGLFKTIRDNNIPLQSVYFLTRHQPMQDPHLDFSNPWPISGFLG
ncbi:MAG: hypothetical protein Q8Q25_00905 [bacterium]|nr:hypothetical protein [bacterium]